MPRKNKILGSLVMRSNLTNEQRGAIREIITGTFDTDGDGIPFWKDADESVMDVLSSLQTSAQEMSDKWDNAVSHIGEALIILEDLASIISVLKEKHNGDTGEADKP